MRYLVLAVALVAPALASAKPLPIDGRGKPVDVALCLDTSNSMDGLIDQAKRKLWAIVNDLARIDPAPTLRVALYSYGNNNYSQSSGWVRKDLDLTHDLDEVYKHLNALKTLGGNEYVARVSRDALADLKWAEDRDALRLLFVCGNEAATQDPDVTLEFVAKGARSRGIIVNTIYCGRPTDGIAAGYRDFAREAGGKFAYINQDAKVPVIDTPYDAKIRELGESINSTYCWYGRKGEAARDNQVAQDNNAGKAAAGAATERGITKAGRLYQNAECDLIDRMTSDKDFDIKKVEEADLPADMRKMTADERLAHLKKKAAERKEIQDKIADLGKQRDKHIADEMKKNAGSGEKLLDEQLTLMIRQQAADKGMKIKE